MNVTAYLAAKEIKYSKSQDNSKTVCYNVIMERNPCNVTKFPSGGEAFKMKNFCIFADALNFIEDNLCAPITQEAIAAACYCSLSSLQKVWRFCTHTSLKEYMSKRRLTKCADDIIHSGMTITEIALKYQYNSPEVFTRAFTKLWGVSPSKFKIEWKSTGIFPRIIPDEQTLSGGNYMRRKVDISELYDALKSKADTYVLCFDIVGLMQINDNISRKAGDKVILEAFKRIDNAAGSDMIAFRIGEDEFALVTGLTDKNLTEELAKKVISLNGSTIECDGNKIPVAVRVGACRYSSMHFRYKDLFDGLQNTINNATSESKVIFMDE